MDHTNSTQHLIINFECLQIEAESEHLNIATLAFKLVYLFQRFHMHDGGIVNVQCFI